MGNKALKANGKDLRGQDIIVLPEIDFLTVKRATAKKLLKVKMKCRKLKNTASLTTGRKISIVKEALPGLQILYEPIKTYYSLDKIIMQSNFGSVTKAYCKNDLDKEVMVKVISLENVTSHLFFFIQELVVFGMADHPNLLRPKSVLSEDDKIYLIFEYDNYVCLWDYVIDSEKLSEEDTVRIITQLLKVVKYLHSIGVCHRDLRPETILINPDTLAVKLLNFEFSSLLIEGQSMKTKIGSAYYMAPEIFSKDYDKEWDIWSIGAIAYFWLTGFPPFLADTPSIVSRQIEEFKLNFVTEDWEEYSIESFAFIRKALTVKVEHRLKLDNALEHPWILRDFENNIDARPDSWALNEEEFDIFLKEIFVILCESFDVESINSLKELYESTHNMIALEILINDVHNIVENTDSYDMPIKSLLYKGLRQLNENVDITGFLESVVEEKLNFEQPKFEVDLTLNLSNETKPSDESISQESAPLV